MLELFLCLHGAHCSVRPLLVLLEKQLGRKSRMTCCPLDCVLAQWVLPPAPGQEMTTLRAGSEGTTAANASSSVASGAWTGDKGSGLVSETEGSTAWELNISGLLNLTSGAC